jgi:glycosyltransferase involved in cell wall biosynthesis
MKAEYNKIISIIIPTHNRGYIIKQCIDSIFCQTYKNFELIVVDDHSEDNTIELLKSIVDNRLKILILEKGKGAQVARNEGIKNASGDWICFNDSDDFWQINKLEINVNYLKRFKYDDKIVFYNDCYIYKESTNEKSIWNLPEIKYFSSYKSLLSGSGPMFQGLFFHKNLIINGGLLDESVPSYQEWDTSLILAKNGAKFYHIKEPLFVYNLHSGETISKNIVRDFNGYQYIINKYKNDIIKYVGMNIWKKHIKDQYMKFMNSVFPLLNKNNDALLVSNANLILNNIDLYFLHNSFDKIYRKIRSLIKKILINSGIYKRNKE